MNYPISDPVLKAPLGDRPLTVDDDVIVAALEGAITAAWSQGQSLEEVTAQVLADDRLLDPAMRRLLSDIVAQAWHHIVPPVSQVSSLGQD